jgi:hypothetical protein
MESTPPSSLMIVMLGPSTIIDDDPSLSKGANINKRGLKISSILRVEPQRAASMAVEKVFKSLGFKEQKWWWCLACVDVDPRVSSARPSATVTATDDEREGGGGISNDDGENEPNIIL